MESPRRPLVCRRVSTAGEESGIGAEGHCIAAEGPSEGSPRAASTPGSSKGKKGTKVSNKETEKTKKLDRPSGSRRGGGEGGEGGWRCGRFEQERVRVGQNCLAERGNSTCTQAEKDFQKKPKIIGGCWWMAPGPGLACRNPAALLAQHQPGPSGANRCRWPLITWALIHCVIFLVGFF